ncbi:putative Ig domain-containing protein [Candidatus Woesearchaeota archaeon]|nr:putative Ig domain-containing protein [Candidatus Woesearchaeota archaeon]
MKKHMRHQTRGGFFLAVVIATLMLAAVNAAGSSGDFAPPDNIFRNNEWSVAVRVGTGSQSSTSMTAHARNDIIYRNFYIWLNNRWQQFSFSQTTLDGAWIENTASKDITVQTAQLKDGTNYMIAYTCALVNDVWKCGCKSQNDCGYWQLRPFTVNKGTTSDLRITTTSLPTATAGQQYSANLQAAGGASPYRWYVSSGNLPSGLSLDGNLGRIYGTPIGSSTQLNIITNSLPNAVAGQQYSADIQASGGQAPHTWEIISGSLPPGLALSSQGMLSGTAGTGGPGCAQLNSNSPGNCCSGQRCSNGYCRTTCPTTQTGTCSFGPGTGPFEFTGMAPDIFDLRGGVTSQKYQITGTGFGCGMTARVGLTYAPITATSLTEGYFTLTDEDMRGNLKHYATQRIYPDSQGRFVLEGNLIRSDDGQSDFYYVTLLTEPGPGSGTCPNRDSNICPQTCSRVEWYNIGGTWTSTYPPCGASNVCATRTICGVPNTCFRGGGYQVFQWYDSRYEVRCTLKDGCAGSLSCDGVCTKKDPSCGAGPDESTCKDKEGEPCAEGGDFQCVGSKKCDNNGNLFCDIGTCNPSDINSCTPGLERGCETELQDANDNDVPSLRYRCIGRKICPSSGSWAGAECEMWSSTCAEPLKRYCSDGGADTRFAAC